MHALNVKTGRRGATVVTRSNSDIAPDHGPIAPFIEPLGRTYAGWVVLTEAGQYAWKAFGTTPKGRQVDAIYAPDGHGAAVRLAVAPYGSIDIVSANRGVVRWRQRGKLHSARLD